MYINNILIILYKIGRKKNDNKLMNIALNKSKM